MRLSGTYSDQVAILFCLPLTYGWPGITRLSGHPESQIPTLEEGTFWTEACEFGVLWHLSSGIMLGDGGRPVGSSEVMIGEGLEETSGSSKGLVGHG